MVVSPSEFGMETQRCSKQMVGEVTALTRTVQEANLGSETETEWRQIRSSLGCLFAMHRVRFILITCGLHRFLNIFGMLLHNIPTLSEYFFIEQISVIHTLHPTPNYYPFVILPTLIWQLHCLSHKMCMSFNLF